MYREPVKNVKGAGVGKPIKREPELVKTLKNDSQEPGAGTFHKEPEPVKEIYNKGSQEPGLFYREPEPRADSR